MSWPNNALPKNNKSATNKNADFFILASKLRLFTVNVLCEHARCMPVPYEFALPETPTDARVRRCSHREEASRTPPESLRAQVRWIRSSVPAVQASTRTIRVLRRTFFAG